MKKLFNFFRLSDLKRDTTLAERRARLENITGVKAQNWNVGKEFDQNKVTNKDESGVTKVALEG